MRRATVMLGLVLIFVAANSGVALGKGPESVTLTGPGAETPIELTNAIDRPISCEEPCPPDPMVRLMEQSGLWYATGDLPLAIHEPDGDDLGSHHVLTWIRSGFPQEPVDERTIHQFLYLHAEGGPVIHTPTNQAGLRGWGDVPEWSRASDELTDTLASLGAESADGIDMSDLILGLTSVTAVAALVLVFVIRRGPTSTEFEPVLVP